MQFRNRDKVVSSDLLVKCSLRLQHSLDFGCQMSTEFGESAIDSHG